MEALESLYVRIWQALTQSGDTVDQVRDRVLYDLYGTIQLDDLAKIDSTMSRMEKKNCGLI